MIHDPSQLAAIERARAGDAIITGAAGYGKTSVIKTIAESLRGEFHLLAPTGKAARRLSDVTGIDARTIHSALGWTGEYFTKAELIGPVIVDEASMIDSWLMAALIKSCGRHLVLVGDDAQLPPVGPGQPFHDLIAIRPKLVCRLDKCYRASAAIHIASNHIRAGQVPPPNLTSDGETWHIKETGSAVSTLTRVKTFIEGGQFDPAQDVFIAPSYEAECGINAINTIAKRHFLGDTGNDFDVGDRVMITKNFPQYDLWNGDAGTITALGLNPIICLDRERGESSSQDQTRELTPAQTRELTLAYCLSVHKSQGSQYRRVFFVCHKSSQHMLDRALVYTAITRAREACVVLGNMATFSKAVHTKFARETILRRCDGLHQDAEILRL